jgi:hypothetical protein
LQHLSDRYRFGPQEVIREINHIKLVKESSDKEVLTNLAVSLRTRPLRWVSLFVDYGGVSLILEYLHALEVDSIHNDFEEIYIKCLKSLMNNSVCAE